MDGDEWTDGRTHTVIKVHICGSWNFVISVGRAFPLPLNALEWLRHFLSLALPGPSMYVISIHVTPI